MKEKQIDALVWKVVERLFSNGTGEEAYRLVLMSADGNNLGGWSRHGAATQIAKVLESEPPTP
jgi:hypothetical protein